MQDGESYLVNEGYTYYMGTMGAGHVINVAGSLLLVCVNDDLEETYTVRDFVTGTLIAEGNMHIEPAYAALPLFMDTPPERKARMIERALKILKDKYGKS